MRQRRPEFQKRPGHVIGGGYDPQGAYRVIFHPGGRLARVLAGVARFVPQSHATGKPIAVFPLMHANQCRDRYFVVYAGDKKGIALPRGQKGQARFDSSGTPGQNDDGLRPGKRLFGVDRSDMPREKPKAKGERGKEQKSDKDENATNGTYHGTGFVAQDSAERQYARWREG